ncbi:MAG: Gfo/Idh/MocA family protein [Bryobacteraceae bacterium]
MNASDKTRRDFLKIPAGAALISAPALLSAQSPNDSIRVAFIGVGNRGSFLMRHTMNVPGVRVAAIADLAPETLRKAGEQAQAAGHTPALYEDFRKMLDEHKDIDAVVIATPTDTHLGIALAALEAGKHVYCEKPMAMTPEECRTLLNASRNAKGIFQAGFQLRHDPNRRASMEFIHKGGIGKVLFLQGYRHTGDLPRNTAWYFDRARSGDNIVEQACHILDLFVWAVGKPPLRAYGSGGINLFHDVPPGRTTMDNYSVIYEFPDDVRVNFSHIYFDPPGFSGIKERVFGADGAIDLATATWSEREKRSALKLEVPDAGQDSNYLSLAAFFDNARNGRTPVNSAESARISTLAAMMGRLSIYEKRVVTWEEVNV